MSNIRQCKVCGEFKGTEDFYTQSVGKGGLSYSCKSCADDYSRKYREANKEKKREYNRKYREANKEKFREYNKKYRARKNLDE